MPSILTKFFIRILLGSYVLEMFATFFLGPSENAAAFEVPLLGRSWQIPELVFYFVIFVWGLLWWHYAVSRTQNGKIGINIRNTFFLFVFFALWGTILGIINRNACFFGDIQGLCTFFTAIPLVAATSKMTAGEIRKLLNVIIFPAVFIAVINIPQNVLGIFGVQTPRFYVDHLISFAYVLGYTIFLGAILNQRARKSDYACFLVLLVALILQFHKPMIMMALVGTGGIILVLLKEKIKLGKAFILGTFLITASLAFVNILPQQIIEHYTLEWRYRYVREDIAGDISGERFLLWEHAGKMIMERPLTGYGFGVRVPNFKIFTVFPEVSPHNLYIYFVMATGIGGGIIFLLLIFQYLHKILTGIHIPDKQTLALYASLVGYFFAILMYNFVGMFLHYTSSGILFSLCIALLLHLTLTGLQTQKTLK